MRIQEKAAQQVLTGDKGTGVEKVPGRIK